MRTSLISLLRAPVPMVALAAGAVLGIAAPLLNTGEPIGHVANTILSSGWLWASFGFFVGVTQTAKVKSAALASASLVVAVVAYYLTQLAMGDFQAADLSDHTGKTRYVSWGSFISMTAVWCLAACTLGSLLGLAGRLARKQGFRGLPFRLVVPLVALYDASQKLRYQPPLQESIVTKTWVAICIISVVAVVVLAGQAVISFGRNSFRDESASSNDADAT